jgi:hypothetical protein
LCKVPPRADGNLSFAEKIERKKLGRLVRKVACIELSQFDQFGGQSSARLETGGHS